MLWFGSHGRGLGEFESLAGFWVFDDKYLVYDYNGFKFITYDTQGNLVSERLIDANPVNPDGFPPRFLSPYMRSLHMSYSFHRGAGTDRCLQLPILKPENYNF